MIVYNDNIHGSFHGKSCFWDELFEDGLEFSIVLLGEISSTKFKLQKLRSDSLKESRVAGLDQGQEFLLELGDF